MLIRKYLKLSILSLGFTAILAASSANAATTCDQLATWGSGRITSVIQDIPGFGNAGGYSIFGIEVSYDLNATKHYYYTYGYMSTSDAQSRTLLQLANMAYATQAPVLVTVNSTCTNIDTFDGKSWINNLKGLTVGSLAKK